MMTRLEEASRGFGGGPGGRAICPVPITTGHKSSSCQMRVETPVRGLGHVMLRLAARPVDDITTGPLMPWRRRSNRFHHDMLWGDPPGKLAYALLSRSRANAPVAGRSQRGAATWSCSQPRRSACLLPPERFSSDGPTLCVGRVSGRTAPRRVRRCNYQGNARAASAEQVLLASDQPHALSLNNISCPLLEYQ